MRTRRLRRWVQAEALRRAQLALLEQPNRSHPLFWAAFTLIGE